VSYAEQMRRAQRIAVTKALARSCGNVAQAAKDLAISRQYLFRLIRVTGVHVASIRPQRARRAGRGGNEAWRALQ
jgi:DNA-binding NtrC family response regulator